MVDMFDGHPDDETPSAVVKYLWRPWEHELGARQMVEHQGPQDQRVVEAENNAEEARSWGRYHEEAHFRTLARQLRDHLEHDAQDEVQTA
jgi:hypothetical protein